MNENMCFDNNVIYVYDLRLDKLGQMCYIVYEVNKYVNTEK